MTTRNAKSGALVAMIKRWFSGGLAGSTHAAARGDQAAECCAPADGFPPNFARVLQPSTVNGLQQLVKQGQREKVASLVQFYRSDAPSRIAAMKQAVEKGDAEELRRAAGTLKWTSMNIGATELSACCQFLEQTTRERAIDPHTDQWLVLRIESLLLAALAAVDTELQIEAA